MENNLSRLEQGYKGLQRRDLQKRKNNHGLSQIYYVYYLINVSVLRETFESDVMKSTWKNYIINSKEKKTCTKKGSINIVPNCELFLYSHFN